MFVLAALATGFDREGGFMTLGTAVNAGVAVLSLEVEGPGDEPGLPEGLGMVTHNFLLLSGAQNVTSGAPVRFSGNGPPRTDRLRDGHESCHLLSLRQREAGQEWARPAGQTALLVSRMWEGESGRPGPGRVQRGEESGDIAGV